jgi:hypothetical protein
LGVPVVTSRPQDACAHDVAREPALHEDDVPVVTGHARPAVREPVDAQGNPLPWARSTIRGWLDAGPGPWCPGLEHLPILARLE